MPIGEALTGIADSASKPSLAARRRNTETVLGAVFVTAMSERPSPLKSALAMPTGLSPAAIGVSVVKLGPSATVTLSPSRLATARSGRPSALKSPTASERGVWPVAKLICGENVPPERSSTVARALL